MVSLERYQKNMKHNLHELQHLIAEIAIAIDQNQDPDQQLYTIFFQHPEYGFLLLELINNLEEHVLHENPAIYSACLLTFDICVAQLQAATEANNKSMAKSLIQLMDRLADLINANKHSLGYWLPVLNSFYEVHAELSPELKEAYFALASEESDDDEERTEQTHVDAIKGLIDELSDLSIFDITENFFAQSYAMPADFFADLVIDLYNIPQGHDIGLLFLLHPNAEVRDVVMATLDQLMEQIVLSSRSLSRLQMIKYWYKESHHARFDRWIKIQRLKKVVFDQEKELIATKVQATEVDGSGAQGLFIQFKEKRTNRLGGLLLKQGQGIKDVWLTPAISLREVNEYYQQAFDESVTLREVDITYFQMMVEHFLVLTIEQGHVPNLHFLELQEQVGMRLRPHKLDVSALLEQLSVQITPFTPEFITASLKRSKSWLKSKQFTESWYLESPAVDKIVNHNSSFVDGIKVCRLEEAIERVFSEVMEQEREQWLFHFLWVTLWLKAKMRKNEKLWQDSFIIAYIIDEGRPLKEIPVMQEICRQTVINSVETMHERKTYLSQE